MSFGNANAYLITSEYDQNKNNPWRRVTATFKCQTIKLKLIFYY